MGLFRRSAPVAEPSVRSLERRVAELEDDYAHLERRFESLRGTVTGAVRRLNRQMEERVDELEQDSDVESEAADFDHSLGAARRFGKESA